MAPLSFYYCYYYLVLDSVWIIFPKLLYLMLVSFYYNSLITVNDTEIFVCINDTPLLKVTFLYVSKYTDILQEFLSSGTKVPGDECSMEQKFHGTFVPENESSRGRKFQGTKVPPYGTFVPGDESS